MNDSSNCTSPDAEEGTLESLFFSLVLLLISVVILLIISFTQRRKRLCRSCLAGFFAVPVPMDFLIAPKYRLIYVITFGVMASNLILFFLNLSSPSFDSVYFTIIFRILIQPLLTILITSLTYLPLFLCADTAIPLLGHSLGLLYSILLLANLLRVDVQAYVFVGCIINQEGLNAVGLETARISLAFVILTKIPVYLSFVFICVWYLVKTITGIVRCSVCLTTKGPTQYTVFQDTGIKGHHAAHVRSLLCRRVGSLRKQPWYKRACNYVFPYQGSSQYFRFPVPFLGAIAAMAMVLYQLCFPIVAQMITLVSRLTPLYNQLTAVLNITGPVDDFARAFIVGLPVIAIIAPFLSLVLCILLLAHMTACVHRQLVGVARHGFKDMELSSPAVQLTASWKFLGSLLGYFTYAWLIYALLIGVLCIVLTILGFGFRYFRASTINFLIVLLVPAIFVRLVNFGQYLCCKYFFLADRTSGGKFIPITNTRLFNWFHYVLFLYNGFAGFIGAIVRAALGTAFGLILLFRLDRIIMMKDFAWFDFGHKAYIGFLHVYSQYNNHVLHTFIHLLQNSASSQSPRTSPVGASRQARNRWLVAYTLLRNPQLQPLTASHLQLAGEEEGGSEADSKGISVGSKGKELKSVTYSA